MIPPVLLNLTPLVVPGAALKPPVTGDFAALLQPAPLLAQPLTAAPLVDAEPLPEPALPEPELPEAEFMALPQPDPARQAQLAAPLPEPERLPTEPALPPVAQPATPLPLLSAQEPVADVLPETVSPLLASQQRPAPSVPEPLSARRLPEAEPPHPGPPRVTELSVAPPQPKAAETAPRPVPEPLVPAPAAAAPALTEPAPPADLPQPAPVTLPTAEAPMRSAEVPPVAAPQPAPAPRSSVTRNVFERLDELEHAEGRTRVLLRPQGLGILEIDVTRLADGRLQVALRAENPLVLQALQQDAGTLTEYLGARGFDMAGGGPDLGRYSRPAPPDTATGPADHSDPAQDAAPDAAPPARQGTGQLDIMT